MLAHVCTSLTKYKAKERLLAIQGETTLTWTLFEKQWLHGKTKGNILPWSFTVSGESCIKERSICNNWAISHALIGQELWSIREHVQTMEMTWWWHNIYSLFSHRQDRLIWPTLVANQRHQGCHQEPGVRDFPGQYEHDPPVLSEENRRKI